MRRVLRPQLVVGFFHLDCYWLESSLSQTGCVNGSELRRLLRPNAVLPDDAVQAEECNPRVLRDVDLVMIDIGRRKHV
jgi:hypothetical protein